MHGAYQVQKLKQIRIKSANMVEIPITNIIDKDFLSYLNHTHTLFNFDFLISNMFPNGPTCVSVNVLTMAMICTICCWRTPFPAFLSAFMHSCNSCANVSFRALNCFASSASFDPAGTAYSMRITKSSAVAASPNTARNSCEGWRCFWLLKKLL